MAKPTHNWLSVKETAARCGVSRRTLWLWHRTGHGPKAYKMSNRKTLYDEDDVESWISGRKGA